MANYAHDSFGERDSGAACRDFVFRFGNKGIDCPCKKKGLSATTSLGAAVNLVAKLGGYLERSNDPPPGHQLMWRGYTYLQLMCDGFMLKGGDSG